MNFTGGRTIMISVAAFLAGVAGTAIATGALPATSQVSASERAKIESVVREYILAHPEIIPEAIERLQNNEAAKAVSANRKALETPYASAWAGNPKGDVTMVVFYDYACGFCRRSLPDIEKLLAEDKNLKVVFRELPILSEDSAKASHAALAAAEQGKFKAFHDALFEAGRPTAANVVKVQKELGIDMAKSTAAAASPAVQREIETNVEMARTLRFTGTPSWVIGDQVLNGAIGYDNLKKAVEKARSTPNG